MFARGLRRSAARAARGAALGGAATLAGGSLWLAPAACEEAKPPAGGAAGGLGGFKMPALPAITAADLAPIGGSISLGSTLGFCSGFAIKKTGKAAAFFVGCLFCVQQALSHCGYVTVNWEKVEQDFTKLLDANKDGKVDAEDLNQHYVHLLKVLQHNTYSLSGGFGAGFLYGVKKG